MPQPCGSAIAARSKPRISGSFSAGATAECLGGETIAFSHGLLWGTVVWASSYAVLPALGLYKPIWEYDATTLAKDLGVHLVYGVTTAAAFRVLAGPSGGHGRDVH